jgi:hypothetical protein
MTAYVGIDPGKDGAIALLAEDGSLLKSWVTPTISGGSKAGKVGRREYNLAAMRDVLQELAPQNPVVTLERSQALPSSMGGSSANFGRGLSFGLWQGLLTGLLMRYEVVSPQRWQKEMFAGMARQNTKQAALIVAGRLWPKERWLATPRCKKAHDGIVDAVLLAEWGRRRIYPKTASP